MARWIRGVGAASLSLATLLVGCGEEPKPAPVTPLTSLVSELDGRKIDGILVYSEETLENEAFRLTPSDRVQIQEVRQVPNAATGTTEAVYRVTHEKGEGWVAGYYLQR